LTFVTPDAAELQRRARKLLPRNVYDYYAGGAGRERTLRASEKAWRQVWLWPWRAPPPWPTPAGSRGSRPPDGHRADLVPGVTRRQHGHTVEP